MNWGFIILGTVFFALGTYGWKVFSRSVADAMKWFPDAYPGSPGHEDAVWLIRVSVVVAIMGAAFVFIGVFSHNG